MPRLRSTVLLVPAALALLAAIPAMAQSTGSSEDGLESFRLPLTLGGAGRATVLSPNLRSTEATVAEGDFRFLIPGCAEVESGSFMCGTVQEYQHCRTLMHSGMISSCRAGVAFASGFAEPYAAEPGEFDLEVESNARIRVIQGDRGFGQLRGEASVVMRFDLPQNVRGAWCLQRDPFIYFGTGPKGGTSQIGEPDQCEEPIEFSFEPHDDDLLRAYDLCENFGVWGEELEDTIEVLASTLFHVRSANPDFVARHPDGIAIVAPYATVKAPVTIDCRN